MKNTFIGSSTVSRYAQFARQRLQLLEISVRGHDLRSSACSPLEPCSSRHAVVAELATAISAAISYGRPVVLMLGAHPIKLGLSRYVVDLMKRRLITHVATNGAGIIHDFELAMIGGTSENVSKWIKAGQFGLWQETSRLNEIIAEGAARGEGLGEAVGRVIEEQEFPQRSLSIAAAGWRYGVPVTSHVGVGCDIIHSMANCNGAALGQASYTDFLIFAESIRHLEGGVFLNIGSAVTGPEVYLKALSMARNVARQEGKEVRHFTTGVFDLVELPDNWRDGPPSKDHPGYYFRPWKTILIRTVADGGQSHYVCGDHRYTIPALWTALTRSVTSPARP